MGSRDLEKKEGSAQQTLIQWKMGSARQTLKKVLVKKWSLFRIIMYQVIFNAVIFFGLDTEHSPKMDECKKIPIDIQNKPSFIFFSSLDVSIFVVQNPKRGLVLWWHEGERVDQNFVLNGSKHETRTNRTETDERKQKKRRLQ